MFVLFACVHAVNGAAGLSSDKLSEKGAYVESIGAVAWWGASLSTVVFAWDIYKWIRKGPRVKVSTKCNVIYPDSRVVSEQQLENGASKELAQYCHIEIVNLGEQNTTIMGIEGASDRKKGEPQAMISGSVFVAHDGKSVPFVLRSGEFWSGRLEMDHLRFLGSRGRPYIAVKFSHKTSPFRAYPSLDGPLS